MKTSTINATITLSASPQKTDVILYFYMLVRLLTTKLCKDSCIRRNDGVSDHQRPPLADEAQRNSGISLIVVNMRTSMYFYEQDLTTCDEKVK